MSGRDECESVIKKLGAPSVDELMKSFKVEIK